MPDERFDPKELAAWRAWQRRELDRHAAWRRHRRAAAAQEVTGVSSRAFNKLEAKLAKLMDDSGIDYEWQFRLGRYVYDFRLPGRILLEAHGTYWHADPRFYAPDKLSPMQQHNVKHDRDKARFAENHGYRLKVVWENEISLGRVAPADLYRLSNGRAK